MMRGLGVTTALVVWLGTAVAGAAPEGWHRSLDDGTEAARKSGKAVLVVTAWGPGV
jgi:hypothetical protein